MIALSGCSSASCSACCCQPDVPLALEPYLPIAVVAALDAVFGALPRLPRRHLRRQGLRHLLRQQRADRGAHRLPRRQARRRRPAVHRRRRRPRHPDLLQRRRHPPPPLPCLSPTTPDEDSRRRSSAHRRHERLRRSFSAPSRGQVVVAVLVGAARLRRGDPGRPTSEDDTYAGLREQDLIQVLNGLAGTAQGRARDRPSSRRPATSCQRAPAPREAALEQAPERGRDPRDPRRHRARTGPGIRITVEDPTGAVGVD